MFSFNDVRRVRIRTKHDIRPAAVALNELVRSIGEIRIGTSHSYGSDETMVDEFGSVLATDVFGWSPKDFSWWTAIHGYTIGSPITLACRHEGRPFWCDRHGLHSPSNNPILRSIDVAGFFEKFHQGRPILVAPVHMPFGNIGALGFTWMDPTVISLERELEQYGDALALLAHVFISDYVNIMCRPVGPRVESALSELEIKCLSLAAIGKTDDEIGEILSRHRGTIRFHLKNAAIKLSTINRSQTILRAAQLGFLPTFSHRS